MDKKDKIVEILESWEKDNGHYFNSISESDYENIADEVVKLFAIPIVVGQSEQLKFFYKYLVKQGLSPDIDDDFLQQQIDNFN